MKATEWNEALNRIDTDIVERYIEEKDELRRRNKSKNLRMRIGALAACFLVVVTTVITLPIPKILPSIPTIPLPILKILPSIPTITSGNVISGKQIASRGEADDSTSSGCYIGPHFFVNTVIQAKMIEILPDSYYEPGSGTHYNVARLSVTESIRGEGLPEEILLRFSEPAHSLSGYDSFIMSLEQIGIENFMMVNDTTREITYFPHMFAPNYVSLLGYGSVIAFNDNTVDTAFWDTTIDKTWLRNHMETLLTDPTYNYPAQKYSTLEETLANVRKLTETDLREYSNSCDYITADDIFCTDEAERIKEYLEPSEGSIFLQSMDSFYETVTYTRVINGFLTEETVKIKGCKNENVTVTKSDVSYSSEDLKSIPDIGKVIAEMDLSKLKPSHINLTKYPNHEYTYVKGFYRKIDGKVYGIVRILLQYSASRMHVASDDCYYLYDENGKGRIVERAELDELLGKNNITYSFDYKPQSPILSS